MKASSTMPIIYTIILKLIWYIATLFIRHESCYLAIKQLIYSYKREIIQAVGFNLLVRIRESFFTGHRIWCSGHKSNERQVVATERKLQIHITFE